MAGVTRPLFVDDEAWQSLTRSARGALPREVGGILLGCFETQGPRVLAAPVVRDPRATRIRYRRDAHEAARILAEAVDHDETGVLGYLGEWHSHPLPSGPSRTDLQSMRDLARDGDFDVVLLVVALSPRGWVGHPRNVTPTGNVETLDLSWK